MNIRVLKYFRNIFRPYISLYRPQITPRKCLLHTNVSLTKTLFIIQQYTQYLMLLFIVFQMHSDKKVIQYSNSSRLNVFAGVHHSDSFTKLNYFLLNFNTTTNSGKLNCKICSLQRRGLHEATWCFVNDLNN